MVVLFERAIQLPDESREQFVAEETRVDPELGARVLAMLRADSMPHPVLDSPGGHLADQDSARRAALEGQTIGPYNIIREIGHGAVATVWQAVDPKHHRDVALKLMNPGVSSALGSERFRQEIEVVARLHHPHILPLYDSGEANGCLYYVMPVIQGETLAERLLRVGPLPVTEVRRIAVEVGSALDYAHRQGVVHRDVKPANILLDEEHAIIADFGIAHRVSDDGSDAVVAAGVVIGTPAYMSPEQVMGEREPDARSDVYGLGCVVFAMLSGGPPFQAATALAQMAQHLHAPIPHVRNARPDLSPAVDTVLARALAKEPSARFTSAQEFVEALDAALTLRPGTRPRNKWRPLVASAAMLLVIILAVTFLPRSTDDPLSIAVLPFVNLSGDSANEYFSDGMTEELTSALAELGRIRVTPRTTAFAYKGRTGDVRRLGEELRVSRILEGSVQRDAERLVVRATLYDAMSGDRLWTARYERDWGSVLVLQAEIADTIAEQLQLTLLPGERARLAHRHTVNPDAYDSYLRGRYFFNIRTNASVQQAVLNFQRALAIDSTYAQAFAGLADSYSILAWTGSEAPNQLFASAEVAARRALELDSLLAEAYISLGIISTFHHWDWGAANRATARALVLDSTQASAWYWRTWHLVAEGRREEALAAISRAQRLEPLSLINNARLATVLAWFGHLETSDSIFRRTLEIDPTYPVARVERARVLSLMNRHREAVAALPADTIRLGSFEAGIAGYVYARAGQRDVALAAVRELEARGYPPAEGIAAIYVGLGDTELALTWLEKAVATRGTSVVFLAVEPMYAPLRGHPRFRRVLEQIGLRT